MSKYSYEVGVRNTIKNLRERIEIIEEGIEAGAWKGDKLKLHKRRLTHYRYHLYYMRQEAKKARTRKKSSKAKAA